MMLEACPHHPYQQCLWIVCCLSSSCCFHYCHSLSARGLIFKKNSGVALVSWVSTTASSVPHLWQAQRAVRSVSLPPPPFLCHITPQFPPPGETHCRGGCWFECSVGRVETKLWFTCAQFLVIFSCPWHRLSLPVYFSLFKMQGSHISGH